jgi:hypothetical protein
LLFFCYLSRIIGSGSIGEEISQELEKKTLEKAGIRSGDYFYGILYPVLFY